MNSTRFLTREICELRDDICLSTTSASNIFLRISLNKGKLMISKIHYIKNYSRNITHYTILKFTPRIYSIA